MRTLGYIALLMSLAGIANAGIGGIAGGEVPQPKDVSGKLVGGSILFQMHSSSVNPLYSRTLCFDGKSFHAQIQDCNGSMNKDSELKCDSKWATQPMKSTREICKDRQDGVCTAIKSVPFVQSPIREIDVYQGESLVKKIEYRVPDCP